MNAPRRDPFDVSSAFWTAFWAVFHDALEQGESFPGYVQSKWDAKPRINPGTALSAAAQLYGTTPDALLGRGRDAELLEARALAVWALRNLGGRWSYPAIGRALGGRDHSTIQSIHRHARALIERSPRFRGACHDIQRRFEAETEIS